MAVAVTALAATAAVAAPPRAGCAAGPSNTGTADIGEWELMNETQLEDAIEATGGDPAQAAGEFATHNKNGDAWVCVMTQVLPNDASGATTWFVAVDNVSRRP